MNRKTTLFLFFFSLFLTVGSFTLQYVFKQVPCSLCILDRILVIILTLFFGFAWLQNPQGYGKQIYRIIGLLLAAAGIALTARHLWIMGLPPEQMPSCTPNYQYLFSNLPFKDAMVTMLQGSQECGLNVGHFMGLSLPAWTMMGFIIIAVAVLIPWHSKNKRF